MKRVLLLLFFGAALTAQSQTNHTINAQGTSWSPNTLTIDVGDSVTFINNGQGLHNVNGTTTTYAGNPESFGMLTSSTNWTYGFRFNTPGTYQYRCDVHSSMMTGTIEVLGGAGLNESSADFSFYPNPATTTVVLEAPWNAYNIAVYDMLGNVVIKPHQVMNQNVLDVSMLNPGTYLLELTNGSEKLTQRLVKN